MDALQYLKFLDNGSIDVELWHQSAHLDVQAGERHYPIIYAWLYI